MLNRYLDIKDNDNVKDIHFPNTNFNGLVDLINFVYEHKRNNQYKTLTLQQISDIKNDSISTISSTKSIAKELGLMRNARDVYSLTQEGYDFAEFIDKEKYDNLRELGEKIVVEDKRSPVLYYAYTVLKQNPSIDNFTLGNLIGKKYNKNWSDNYKRNLGNYTRKILLGFQLIDPPKPIKTSRVNAKKTTNQKDKILPRISIKSIKEYITTMENNKPVNFFKEFESKANTTIKTELNILAHLNLVKKYNEDNYILSKKGSVFKKSIEENNDRETFQTILLNYKPIEQILSKIRDENITNIDYLKLGKLIQKYNNEDYSDTSIKIYGSKILEWLKYSQIIINKNGEYMLNEKVMRPNENGMSEVVNSIYKNINKNNHQNKSSIESELIENYCELFYSVAFINSNEWALNNYKKNEINDNIHAISKKTDGIKKILYDEALKWLNEAFDTNNRNYLKNSYDMFRKIQKIS